MSLDLSALQKAIDSLDSAIQYSKKLPSNIDSTIVRDSAEFQAKIRHECVAL